jgi:hypothetical protein
MLPFRRRRTPFLLAAVKKNGDLGSSDPVSLCGQISFFKNIVYDTKYCNNFIILSYLSDLSQSDLN